MLYHIVAVAGDAEKGEGVIGKNNQLPWPKFPEDMKFFRAATDGGTVIMGRKTFESLGCRPLPNRENFVLSRSDLKVPEGVGLFHSIDDGLRQASRENIFIIGGADLYRQTLDRIDGIYLTRIDGSYSGDVKYPAIPACFQVDPIKSRELSKQYHLNVVFYQKAG